MLSSLLFFSSPTFKMKDPPEKHLVIIQCDSGHLNGDLIACARYRIYDFRAKADKDQITHVLLIIHLPHQVINSSFVSFQGSPWVSYHIDDLRPPTDKTVAASEAIKFTISELFFCNHDEKSRSRGGSIHGIADGKTNSENEGLEYTVSEVPTRSPLFSRLHGCIQAAASKLQDITPKRFIKRIEILLRLMPKNFPKGKLIIHYIRECVSIM